jgi:hypothetical protein
MIVMLHDILDIDEEEEVFIAEESLADLISLPVTVEILQSSPDLSDSIVIREDAGGDGAGGGDEGNLLGVAMKLSQPAEVWLLVTDRYGSSHPLAALPTPSASKVVRVEERLFFEGLVEWLSLALRDELFCDSCPIESPPLFVPEREGRLVEFLRPIMPAGGEVLEICAGSGMATQALKRLGFRPWTEDLDSCEICMGLKSGHLEANRSMALDALLLDRFFPPQKFDAVVGFMVGLIDEVNWPLWREILIRSSKLARDLVIYTTYTEREAGAVAGALSSEGWDCEVVANPDDLGIYDQWACVGRRHS